MGRDGKLLVTNQSGMDQTNRKIYFREKKRNEKKDEEENMPQLISMQPAFALADQKPAVFFVLFPIC